jgi:hypothetical protein
MVLTAALREHRVYATAHSAESAALAAREQKGRSDAKGHQEDGGGPQPFANGW